ncbi:MAG: MFS transporter [Chloroflexi bacterium]|nr:MFS transporter [Chloroflexota bacterium]
MQERHRAGGLLLFALFAMGLNFLAPAPLLPLVIESMQVSQTAASLLVGGIGLVLALGMTPGGMLAARLGVKRSLALGCLLLSAMALTPLAPGFEGVLALRFVFALGAALAVPASAVFIMQWFPSRELPIWNAAAGSVQSLGIAVSTFLAAPLAQAFGWRATLACYGAVMLAAALLWMLLGRNKPGAASAATGLGATLAALREPTTLLLAAAYLGPIGQFSALTSWLPAYYTTAHGMDLAGAGALVRLLSLIGIPATLMGGILPQRLGVRRPLVLGCGALVGVAGAGSYLLAGTPLLIPALLAVGLCSWLYFPVTTTMVMELPGMTPAKVGVVLAAAVGLGNLAGFVAPLTVGFLADQTGSFVPGFVLWSVASVGLLLAGMRLPETGPRAKGYVAGAAPLAETAGDV